MVKKAASHRDRSPSPPAGARTHPGVAELVKRLEVCLETFRIELKRSQRAFGEASVHDLRVTTRRLSVTMEMGSAINRKKGVERSRRSLKSFLDAFDALRDVQVLLLLLDELPLNVQEIEPFRTHLQQREKRMIAQLAKKVKGFQTEELAKQINKLRKALLRQDETEAEGALWAAVDRSYHLARMARAAVRSEQSLTIHRLRLAFKKFRYMVEAFIPLLPYPPDDYLDHLHAYQTAMGDIQDAEMGLIMLDLFASNRQIDLPAIRAAFGKKTQEKTLAFMVGIDELDTFWRLTPQAPFPWEGSLS